MNANCFVPKLLWSSHCTKDAQSSSIHLPRQHICSLYFGSGEDGTGRVGQTRSINSRTRAAPGTNALPERTLLVGGGRSARISSGVVASMLTPQLYTRGRDFFMSWGTHVESDDQTRLANQLTAFWRQCTRRRMSKSDPPTFILAGCAISSLLWRCGGIVSLSVIF